MFGLLLEVLQKFQKLYKKLRYTLLSAVYDSVTQSLCPSIYLWKGRSNHKPSLLGSLFYTWAVYFYISCFFFNLYLLFKLGSFVIDLWRIWRWKPHMEGIVKATRFFWNCMCCPLLTSQASVAAPRTFKRAEVMPGTFTTTQWHVVTYHGIMRPMKVHRLWLTRKPTVGSVMASQARPTNRMMDA